MHYNNGDRYEGDFKNDKFEGKGIYYWDDGRRYVGRFLLLISFPCILYFEYKFKLSFLFLFKIGVLLVFLSPFLFLRGVSFLLYKNTGSGIGSHIL